jgi:hypothetical protein
VDFHEGGFLIAGKRDAGCTVGFVADDKVEGFAKFALGFGDNIDGVVGREDYSKSRFGR